MGADGTVAAQAPEHAPFRWRLLEKETTGIELIPPRLTLPYFLSEAAEIRRDAEFLTARIKEAMKIEHTFFQLTYPGR